ncbi:hypothetical protein BD324DRAFT_263320 [Kockovaella imperatae]|uniref:RING-type domain-containing protein n=1 Tax=Kockovaella imperatae TaxID=4999 RepID=A0A1Y1UQ36_9TREE|nr:hypothetical protein BD324DRAFT_263320 [Kockovaella imperatae]ORX40170.1 hypothetical protein BD324DRAFT_263320 [Kockovaella imperatae]
MATPSTPRSAGAFRSSRLRAPSLLPQARFTALPVQQTLVIDSVRRAGVNGENKEDGSTTKRRETIFGPDVGEDDEPGWTKPEEGARVDVDVVKGWVEKAKSEEGLHSTTTLQALVNLKRPTLLLQHLEADRRTSIDSHPGGEITSANDSRVSVASPVPTSNQPLQQPLHVLKFNYDATTPLVNITLSICPAPPPAIESPDGKSIPSLAEEEPRVIYTGTHQGGFNQVFNLAPESALDLSSAIAPAPGSHAESQISLDKNLVSDPTRTSTDIETGMQTISLSGAGQPDLATVPEVPSQANGNARERANSSGRRFGLFGRRNRQTDPETGGIEMENREDERAEENQDLDKGLRLLIRLEGVGAEGAPLKRRNAQLTHILISGMWSPDTASTNPIGQHKQVWVVKVVRREALIGAHTFLLKEIYGLSATHQSSTPASYPPSGTDQDPYSSTPNECIVCLTSPRDVVLLPCRHLVVCRECAVGMVEFGAGGKVARREEAPADGDAAGGEGTGTAGAPATGGGSTQPPVAGGTTATGRERRKKKAKGWYCPVCRQPYTSLLRLALPASDKPETGAELARAPSRAHSIRSVRTTHTIPPTLPAGAEAMLEKLRPSDAQDDDEEDGDEHHGEGSRPQFVVGEDEDKAIVGHEENVAELRKSEENKGWKEHSAV